MISFKFKYGKWLAGTGLALLLAAFFGCRKPSVSDPGTGINTVKNQNQFRDAIILNAALSKGINYGSNHTSPYGERWWAHDYDSLHFHMMVRDGFKHVRIFFNWERIDRANETAPYAIHQDYMDSIKTVIEDALGANLYVIMGGGGESIEKDAAAGKEKFLARWAQIANAFKGYSDRLLFEIMNEPNEKENTPAAFWNQLAAEALSVIRQTNPKRCILLATPEFNHIKTIDWLQIPADPNLILTLHYYEPFWFTHQGAHWVGNDPEDKGYKWNDSEVERIIARDHFKRVLQVAAEKNIPIHIGEFGVYKVADMPSRIKWTRYMARMFEDMGFSWCHWEFSDDFDIYNAVTDQTVNLDLLRALVQEPIPAPGMLVVAETLFTNEIGSDRWGLYQEGTGNAMLAISDNKAIINIANSGTADAHVLLYRWGVPMVAGKFYHVVFNAASANDRAIDLTIENTSDSVLKREPFRIDGTDHQYHYIFKAPVTDAWGKIKFRFGTTGPGTVTLHSVKMEEVVY